MSVTCHPRQQGSWGQHGTHLGPFGPRGAPCWPHEPCYQGFSFTRLVCMLGDLSDVEGHWHLRCCINQTWRPIQTVIWENETLKWKCGHFIIFSLLTSLELSSYVGSDKNVVKWWDLYFNKPLQEQALYCCNPLLCGALYAKVYFHVQCSNMRCKFHWCPYTFSS